MKYEKVHSIYNRLLAIEDIDPTLVRRPLALSSSAFAWTVTRVHAEDGEVQAGVCWVRRMVEQAECRDDRLEFQQGW